MNILIIVSVFLVLASSAMSKIHQHGSVQLAQLCGIELRDQVEESLTEPFEFHGADYIEYRSKPYGRTPFSHAFSVGVHFILSIKLGGTTANVRIMDLAVDGVALTKIHAVRFRYGPFSDFEFKTSADSVTEAHQASISAILTFFAECIWDSAEMRKAVKDKILTKVLIGVDITEGVYEKKKNGPHVLVTGLMLQPQKQL